MQIMYQLSEHFDDILSVSSVKTDLEVKTLDKIFKDYKVKKVLDIACGTGRHAIPLAQLGYEVTGIDYSQSQISVARKKAKKTTSRAKFYIKDANNFRFKGQFGAATCMWSTIAEEPMQYRKVINNAYLSLKPRGIFVIDNKNWDLVRKDSRVRKYTVKGNGVVIKKVMWDRYTDNYRVRQAKFDINGKKYDELCLTQLLSPTNLVDEMKKAGFQKFQIWRDYKKTNSTNPERFLIIGTKQ